MAKSQIVWSQINCMSSLIQSFAAITGSIRQKTKIVITMPPLNAYLSEIRFWAQENMSQLLVEKKFYQHTVTLKPVTEIYVSKKSLYMFH